MIRNPKVHVCFITFMLKDEHRLSLGMLMHVKFIHELSIYYMIFLDICMIYEVPYMF
jgi:hypothetical protein